MQALVLDHNRDDCAIAMGHLQRAGYETIAVASLQEAREALEESAFDLMLLEMALEDGNGLHLCAEFRERFGNDPIVIIVSHASTSIQRVLSFDLGADDFMDKPCDGEELLARIEARRRRR